MRIFWPAAEAAQVDYECLRSAALAGELPETMVAARFSRRGVAGLIAWPASEAVFAVRVIGAVRPAWTPRADPRMETLAGAYELLVAAPAAVTELMEASR